MWCGFLACQMWARGAFLAWHFPFISFFHCSYYPASTPYMSERTTSHVPWFFFQESSLFPQFLTVSIHALLWSCHRLPRHCNLPLDPYHTLNHIIHWHILRSFLRYQGHRDHAATKLEMEHISTWALMVVATPLRSHPPGNTTMYFKFLRSSCTTNNIHRLSCCLYFIAFGTLRYHKICLQKFH